MKYKKLLGLCIILLFVNMGLASECETKKCYQKEMSNLKEEGNNAENYAEQQEIVKEMEDLHNDAQEKGIYIDYSSSTRGHDPSQNKQTIKTQKEDSSKTETQQQTKSNIQNLNYKEQIEELDGEIEKLNEGSTKYKSKNNDRNMLIEKMHNIRTQSQTEQIQAAAQETHAQSESDAAQSTETDTQDTTTTGTSRLGYAKKVGENNEYSQYEGYYTSGRHGGTEMEVTSTFGSKTHTVTMGDKEYTIECGGGIIGGGCSYSGDRPQNKELAGAGLDLVEQAEDNKGDMYEKATDGENEIKPTNVRKQQDKLLNELAGKGRGRIRSILSSWTNYLFGQYIEGFPAYICGDSLYRKEEEESETESKGIFDSMTAPETEFKSNMEKEILEDTKTTMLAGEKTEVDKDLYRYAVTMRLVGGPEGDEWELYLYNSCTDESSRNDFKDSDGKYGWLDYGRISKQQYIGRHYAGGQSGTGGGESMIFDCTKEACRFNKVCVKYKNDKEPICNTLAFGGGFRTPGETGSLQC